MNSLDAGARMNLKTRTWVVIAACFGVAMFIGLRISAISSDGYQFLDQAIRRSPQIQARLGEVEAVQVSYLGEYRQKAVGADRWLTITLNVTGRKGSATIRASAKKIGGAWSVTSSSIGGEPVSLN
jgi:Cytochrome oxidase complex assembly protein 1